MPGKGRLDLFQKDGIHLTQKGVYTMETNLILAIHEERPDLSNLGVHRKKIPPKPSQGLEGKVKQKKAGPALTIQPGGSQDVSYPPPCTSKVQGSVTPQYNNQQNRSQQQYNGLKQQFGQQQQQQQFGQQQFGQQQFGEQQLGHQRQFGQQQQFGHQQQMGHQQQFGQQYWGPQQGYGYSYPQQSYNGQWLEQGGW